jgi:signal peptidase II
MRFWLFIGFNGVLMSIVAGSLIMQWSQRLTIFVPLVLLLAGGVGNLIDRVSQNGFVTDFISVGVGPLRTGIFNVADVAVTFGAVALVLTLQSSGSQAETNLGPQELPEIVRLPDSD